MSRYLGEEQATGKAQVVRYLTENYADAGGTPMPRETAQAIVDERAEQVEKGIRVFGSNVYYLGDEAVRDSSQEGWVEIPEPEEEQEGEE